MEKSWPDAIHERFLELLSMRAEKGINLPRKLIRDRARDEVREERNVSA